MSDQPELDPRYMAAVDMVRRTGARQFQLRYQDDEEPAVWIAVSRHIVDANGIPVAGEGEERWEAAGAISPLRAVLRLCETLIDGGMCAHCGRPAGFDENFGDLPLAPLVCWTQFDPELATFRRGCE